MRHDSSDRAGAGHNAPTTARTATAAGNETRATTAGANHNDEAPSAESSPEWGRSYGFDALPPMPADPYLTTTADTADHGDHGACDANGYGAGAGCCDARAAGVGPVWTALTAARNAIADVAAGLDTVAVTDLAGIGDALHQLGLHVDAAHLAAVAAVRRHGALPPGSATAADWLATHQQLTGGRAHSLARAATWLDDHPETKAAFNAGKFSTDHLLALISVVNAKAARRNAYPKFETHLLTITANTNLHELRRFLRGWADTVDADSSDDDAAEDHRTRRGIYLSAVADGWDLRGWLTGVEGAELSGILNEYLNRAHGEDPENTASSTAAARRADALLDIARAAGNANLPDATRTRAAVTILIPAHHLPHTHTADTDADPGTGTGTGTDADPGTGAGTGTASHYPGIAHLLADARLLGCTWSCSNGPGQGFLCPAEAAWASCDAQVTRLIVGPDSMPLDIGRATRVVPAHMRRALIIRDKGCITPGCTRPAAWCEAHHVKHWADGGDTAVENLALLCEHHHKELHLGMWTITTRTGRPVVTRNTNRGGRNRNSAKHTASPSNTN